MGAGAVAVLWLWWTSTPSIADTTGKIIAAGRITGLLAGYLMALVVLQMARVPALERRVGSDRVARWHAMSGRYTVSLVVAHVFLIMWGYARQAGKSLADIVSQTVTSINTLPDMGKAAIGTGLLFVIALLSVGPVRRRLPYDGWYHVHLLTYAAVFLTFWHQITTGNEFAVTPSAKSFWYGLYGAVTVRAGPVVPDHHPGPAEPPAPDAGAGGHRGDARRGVGADRRAPAAPDGRRGGAVLPLAVPGPGMRFSSHPYSLSAAPRPDMLRITVKAIGDHSSRLRELEPGTRVWAEGPYGALTAQRRSRGKVLLVAGGVGITPMRALFETLPGASGDITLLYRANSTQDLALWGELAKIADERGARLMYAVNSPDGERPDISAESLRRKIPDVDRHDVFMCGPPGFAQQVYAALRDAGVPARRIHHESFEM